MCMAFNNFGMMLLRIDTSRNTNDVLTTAKPIKKKLSSDAVLCYYAINYKHNVTRATYGRSQTANCKQTGKDDKLYTIIYK